MNFLLFCKTEFRFLIKGGSNFCFSLYVENYFLIPTLIQLQWLLKVWNDTLTLNLGSKYKSFVKLYVRDSPYSKLSLERTVYYPERFIDTSTWMLVLWDIIFIGFYNICWILFLRGSGAKSRESRQRSCFSSSMYINCSTAAYAFVDAGLY